MLKGGIKNQNHNKGSIFKTYFKIYLIIALCGHARARVRVLGVNLWEGGSRVSPSTLWAPRIELRSHQSSLAELSHQPWEDSLIRGIKIQVLLLFKGFLSDCLVGSLGSRRNTGNGFRLS